MACGHHSGHRPGRVITGASSGIGDGGVLVAVFAAADSDTLATALFAHRVGAALIAAATLTALALVTVLATRGLRVATRVALVTRRTT